MRCEMTQYGFDIVDCGKSLVRVERCCHDASGKSRWYIFNVKIEDGRTYTFTVKPRKTTVTTKWPKKAMAQ